MLNANRRKITDTLKLYLILETDMLKMPLADFIPQVVDGGVTAIQLRNKFGTARENYEIGLSLQSLLNGTDVLFVVNDRVDMAAALSCPNVHVGIKDLPIDVVKQQHPDWVVGYSCNNTDDIQTANGASADYIGVGPAFSTDTKKDLRGVIGPDGIAALVAKANMPAVAIGGISVDNVDQLSGCGLAGVAVSSAICATTEPGKVAAAFRHKIDQF